MKFSIKSFIPNKTSIIPNIQARYSPKIYENYLVISQDNGLITCLDTKTYQEIWSYTTHKPEKAKWIGVFDTVINNQNDFFVTLENEIIKINLKTGKVIANYLLPENSFPSFSSDHIINERLFSISTSLNNFNSRFYCFDFHQKKIVWENIIENTTSLMSVADLDLITLFNTDNSIITYNINNGKVLWNIDSLGTYFDHIEKKQRNKVASGIPIILNNSIIFGLSDKYLRAVDKSSGTTIWEISIPEKAIGNYASDANGVLHIIGANNYYKVDSQNGKLLSQKNVQKNLANKGYYFFSTPTVTEELLFFVETRKGKIFGMEVSSGDIVWEYQCKAQVSDTTFPIIVNNKIYLTDSEKHLYVFSKD